MAKKEEADPVSLWERLERPAAAPRTSLTPQRIAEVAIGIADRDGFEAVTMRKIAAELGVAPMAAYRHVEGKDELWALMVDRVSAELEPAGAEAVGPEPAGAEAVGPEPAGPEPAGAESAGAEPAGAEAVGPEPAGPEPAGPEAVGPEPAGAEAVGPEPAGPEPAGAESAGAEPAGGAADWRGTLRAHAVRSRESMLRHPWLAQMPAPLFAITPNRMAAAERQLAALDGLGLDADTMMAAFRAVSAYVHGAVQAEAALRRYMAEQGWGDGDETRRALAPQMSYLMETGRYPTYRRYAHGAARKDDAEWQFLTGLDCVLDGVAGLVEGRGRA
ncbi:TetR/AcrR family transcriptional regulator C-terminal domain-containing protein [Streptomyces sp. NPDC058326]|uniref:TetR/AcrR family transcriptional regulator n=1 Tax=Streptomyces sp. NPDC058326 TaxID=3346447 RepID=UPI0036E11B57